MTRRNDAKNYNDEKTEKCMTKTTKTAGSKKLKKDQCDLLKAGVSVWKHHV